LFAHLSFQDLTFKAFINFSLRLSALEFCREITAQIAAGIQPIKVICKIRQIIAVNIFPLKRNEANGKKIAINVILQGYEFVFNFRKVFW